MKIIEPYWVIETEINRDKVYKFIESSGRTCYKSECKATEDSAEPFVRKILAPEQPHESVIEHFNVTVRFICDRGVTHELVRHRLAAYSQESTRYCNYSHDKFSNEITVIKPCFWEEGCVAYETWRSACESAEAAYFALLSAGAKPQEARSVLPNSLKTEIVMTANLREWRHVFKLRASAKAHPQMRQLMVPLLKAMKEELPAIFNFEV